MIKCFELYFDTLSLYYLIPLKISEKKILMLTLTGHDDSELQLGIHAIETAQNFKKCSRRWVKHSFIKQFFELKNEFVKQQILNWEKI
jgi:hypothetical protein